MKKTPLFLMALSAVALASCSEDEPVSTRQASNEAISFRSAMGTRATETTNANLDKIYVTAFAGLDSLGKSSDFKTTPYFENAEFDKGSDSFFTAALGKKYDWLAPKQILKFYSYSPSQDELGADILPNEDEAGVKLTGFTVADQIADQVDFVTATAHGNRNDNETSGVELTFDHRLAQIEIRAKSESDTYTYKVAGARIGRAQYMGDFDFNTNTWTLDLWHDTNPGYDTSCDTTVLTATPVSLMGSVGNAMLLPQTLTEWNAGGDPDNSARGAYLGVLVRVTRTDNGYQIFPFTDDGDTSEFSWASIPISGTWEQGKKYIYTLDFTKGAGYTDPDDPHGGGEKIIGGPIKFTVQVNDWTDANSDKTYDMNSTIKQD